MPPNHQVVAAKDVQAGDVILEIDGEATTHMRVERKTQMFTTVHFHCIAHYTGRKVSARAAVDQPVTVVREEP
jgi:nicotinate-nucleotide pyrophosphorylase